MMETSRSNLFKLERAVVPMAKGDRSKVVLELAFSLSEMYNTEITALTVKEEVKEVTWSDKVSVVINAYRDGKDRNIKVIPKVRTSASTKQGIVDEVNSKSYDILLLGTFKRSLLSGSLFGGIGDYVMKHSRVPTALVSIKGSTFPYRKILLPLSESLNTRGAVSFALQLKKALGSDLTIADLRKFDKHGTHGFSVIFDRFGEVVSKYGENITIIRPGYSSSLVEEVHLLIGDQKPDLIILGVTENQKGKVRFNSDLKNIIKATAQDTIVVKK
ncbi:MAG: universal stress protein [Candidatus Thermoplasmatota archaeon]|nr:universal stress protein [Candidatus Thermoplasmatota archaeon]